MNRIKAGVILALLLNALLNTTAQAANVSAVSCSATDVQNALNAASTGDTVMVPAGTCTWSNVSVNKPVVLKGAGVGQTNITVNGNQSLTVTKQAAGVTRIQGFSFSASNLSGLPDPIVIQGSWLNAKPVIFQNNAFSMNSSSMFSISVAGGVIFSHNSFTGGWNDFSFSVKDLTNTNSWSVADSMGNHDSSGTMNIYIEDNTFYGQSNGTIDCDDNCRVVVRHNTFSYGGFNSHGDDTSPYGMRHFEIYSNNFLYPESSSTLANVSQTIWIRGGTGVIFNNTIADVIGQNWGDKPELKLSVRGAEDARPQGSCAQVSYRVPHQLGQNNNGTGDFTDPIYIWGNTGTLGISEGWVWGNPCGLTWSTFFQWNRDAVSGSTAKPGYTPYTYPHPLAVSGAPLPPPGNLTVAP
jgi:hypothetical protein